MMSALLSFWTHVALAFTRRISLIIQKTTLTARLPVLSEMHLRIQHLPEPPAMWKIAELEVKTEGIMRLSMGVQKAIFKFIIKWAAQYKKGNTLQQQLAKNLRAV
jgi:hypothetical protein